MRRGTVLMEYMVVNILVGLVVLTIWNTQLYSFAEKKWRPDTLGGELCNYCQRVLSSIALPIP